MNFKRDNFIQLTMFVISLQACASNEPDAKSYPNTGGVDAAPDPVTGPTAGSTAPTAPPPAAASRKAYIGLFGDGAIGVLDTMDKRILKTIPVSAPDGLVISPDGKKVFVSSADTASVKVLDTRTDSLVASIDVGAKPAGLTITPDGHWLVASVGGADEAVLIDAGSNEIVRHVPVGQAHSSCVTPDGRYAYVGSQVSTAPAVVKVDLEQDTPPTTFPVDKSPRALACETEAIYFTVVGLDAVERLDPATGKLDTPITSGGSPHDVRAAQAGETELVVSQTAGDLEFIDVASASVIANVPTGKLAHWITLSPDHSVAYVTNEGDNNVSVVNLASRSVVDTIEVGQAPRKMAIQP
jgi:YVTN family beta-propeller protein